MLDFEKLGDRHGSMFGRWWYHEAEWWEFWYPQSGASGGGMIGAAIFIIVFGLIL